jgi:integrase
LAAEETLTENGLAGATTLHKPKKDMLKDFSEAMQASLLKMAVDLLKDGREEATVNAYIKDLHNLVTKQANLYDPENVKEVIARQQWSNGYKRNVIFAYEALLKTLNGTWKRPKYKRQSKEPWIPPEVMVDQLIAHASRKLSVFTQTTKETGARPGEVHRIPWTDIDMVHNRITINYPEKGGNPRTINVSHGLIARLNLLPKKTETVFGKFSGRIAIVGLTNLRRSLAQKMQDDRFKKINFTTLRHFKGTWEYYNTKDIRHVQYVLGHKSIQNTLIYVQIVEAWQIKPDMWTSRVASNVEEACKLVEAGFEYVGCIHGAEIFRRPKRLEDEETEKSPEKDKETALQHNEINISLQNNVV